MKKLDTHCNQGHQLTQENTYVSPKSGQRHCRICLSVKHQSVRGICEEHNRPGCICLMGANPRNTEKGQKKEPRRFCLRGHELTEDNVLFVGTQKKRRCRLCAANKNNEWKSRNVDKVIRGVKKSQRKRLYNISEEQYQMMLEKQSGLCGICGLPPTKESLCIDHNHKTDEVRGLVHRVCNTGIGNLKDDPILCRLAADYLENPPA